MAAEHPLIKADARDAPRPGPIRRADRIVSQPSSDNNWADLCADLVGEFPTLDGREVIEAVARARSATNLFGLDLNEQIRATATIARNNLRLMTGEADLARLDPETHVRRKDSAR